MAAVLGADPADRREFARRCYAEVRRRECARGVEQRKARHSGAASVQDAREEEHGEDRVKILVTGGTGFLGSHFMNELCKREDAANIRVLSLFNTPALDALGVDVVIGTVTSEADMARAMDGITHVYHLAGFVSRKPEDAHLIHWTRIFSNRLTLPKGN